MLINKLMSKDDVIYTYGLPWRLSGQQSTSNARAAGDAGSIPVWGRSPGGMHDHPFQYSCLENTLAREAWQDTVLRVAESDIIKVT